MALTIGSFCTGIGGLDLATAAHFGADVAWHCEVDAAPSKVLEYHFPSVPNHGDIKTTDWLQVAPVDIITAGYPCQPFSTAGQRKGSDDERHLWPAIRDAIGVLRPRFVVLENVRGHLSLGFAEVLADLAGLGFNAEWGCFRSSDVGAPHRRERLYVVATASDADGAARCKEQDIRTQAGKQTPLRHDVGRRCLDDEGGGRVDCGVSWGDYGPAVSRWEAITGTLVPAPLDAEGRLAPALAEWMMGYPAGWVTDPAIGLSRAQQLKACGNAVQPQTAALALSELAWR